MSMPTYGQRSNPQAAPECQRHPGVRSVDYCKKCNRPVCMDCLIRTEVRSICVDCSGRSKLRIQRRGPVVTYTVIALCTFVFLIGFFSSAAYQAMAFRPDVALIQPWRFLTTAFLHSGILHLVFNMLALFWVGTALEPALGHWRFASLYGLSAVGGTAAVLIWGIIAPLSLAVVTVGASGAIFGLFGAIFVMQKAAGMDTRAVVVLLGINLIYGFIGSDISWQGHLGGLLTGLLVTWVYLRLMKPRPSVTEKRQNQQMVLASIGMWIGMIAVIAVAYRVIFEVWAS